MNLFSHFIGSLFHQHYGNPDTEFSCYRYNRDSGDYVWRMPAANRTKEFPDLSVLADCRPGSLDEFASQPWVSAMGDRSSISSLAGGVLSGNQTQKPCQLTDVLKLSPVADAGQKLASRNPTNPRNAHQVFHAAQQLRIFLTEAADLLSGLKNPFLIKLHAVQQLIELKAHRRRAGEFSQLSFHGERPLAAGRSRGKFNPFKEQQRFNPLLHPHHVADKSVAQLGEVAQLTIHPVGT